MFLSLSLSLSLYESLLTILLISPLTQDSDSYGWERTTLSENHQVKYSALKLILFLV